MRGRLVLTVAALLLVPATGATAAPLSSGCEQLNNPTFDSIFTASIRVITPRQFSAGEQIQITAGPPIDSALVPTVIRFYRDTPGSILQLVAQEPYPGTLIYTVPEDSSFKWKIDTDGSNVTFSLDCVLPAVGSIAIVKATDAPEVPDQFTFTGDVDAVLDNGASETIELPVGVYSIAEVDTNDDGWKHTGISCSDGTSSDSAEVQVTVVEGVTVTCTFSSLRDQDNDGVPRSEEPGDANADGIPDDQQNTVATAANMTIRILDTGSFLKDVAPVQLVEIGSGPPGVNFPEGLVGFTAGGPGVSAEQFILHVDIPLNPRVATYWKYGATTDDPTPHWYDFEFQPAPGGNSTGAIIRHYPALARTTIELFFVDGQRGDSDLVANGFIIDPGGAAIVEPTCTIEGTEDRDVLWGTDDDDVICGYGGNDLIFGLGGDDTVLGGDGDDWLFGSRGNDRLDGGAGDDRIFGSRGDDFLLGADGSDRLFGGKGLDQLFGEDGEDFLFGGQNDDTLTGGGGDDSLRGGPGNDEEVQ